MPQRAFVLALAALMFPLAACGETDPPSAATEDIVFLRSGNGVAVMQVAGGEAGPLYADEAVPTTDWSTVVKAETMGYVGTHLAGVDPATGDERWSMDVSDGLGVTVVSHDGAMAALSPLNQPIYSGGRERTELVVANGPSGEQQSFDLAGNFEPEAFSTDHSSLFVISFTPARNPSKYQVRRLDLASGKVEDVFTPHGELQGTMGGSSRVQTANPDGTRLYTLYTVDGGKNGTDRAFIHVLDLEQQWAHCIDLPPEFVPSAGRATAITSAPDGSNVFVANTMTGALAEIDPIGLSVARVTNIDMPFGRTASSAVADASTLYLATGAEAIAVDIGSLTPKGLWTVDGEITGLQVTGDGKRLYLGLRDYLAQLDVATGEIATIDAPGIDNIRRFGPALQQVTIGDFYKCAC